MMMSTPLATVLPELVLAPVPGASPANDTTAPVARRGAVKVWEIRERVHTFRGRLVLGAVAVGHHAEVLEGVSIRLFGEVPAGKRVAYVAGHAVPVEEHPFAREFRIGDQAVYGAYNFVYTGSVVAITDKTITVQEEQCGPRHRMSLYDFDRWNWDFDEEKTAKRNREWRD